MQRQNKSNFNSAIVIYNYGNRKKILDYILDATKYYLAAYVIYLYILCIRFCLHNTHYAVKRLFKCFTNSAGFLSSTPAISNA